MLKNKNRDIGFGEEPSQNTIPSGKNYLLAIGIDKYQDKDIPTLSNCVRDAKALISVLKKYYNFLEDNITTLFDEDATLEKINIHLDTLSEEVDETDNVLIYFGGHGYYNKNKKAGYLIPVEGKNKKYWGFLSNDDLLAHIRGINSLHTFLLLDSCFSGSLFRDTPNQNVLPERVERYPSRWALASGSIEKVSDGFHGDNSPFIKSVITFLQQNQKKKIPVSDLVQFVRKATANNAKQTPKGGSLFKVGDMTGEFVFYKKMTTSAPTEQQLFEQAKESQDVFELRIFLSNSKNRNHKKVIRSILKQLESDELWEQVNKKSFAELDEFIDDHPKHSKVEEARALLAAFLERPKQKTKKQSSKPSPKPKIIQTKPHIIKDPNLFVDPRDGQEYKTVKLKDGNIWLAENLNFKVKDSWYHKEVKSDKDKKRFGRLYTWESAKEACPSGWHVPSDEEWNNMIQEYGGLARSYNILIKGGSSGFSAQLGGFYSNDNYFKIGECGYYWSTTESGPYGAYNHALSQNFVIRYTNGDKLFGLSCRCLKD